MKTIKKLIFGMLIAMLFVGGVNHVSHAANDSFMPGKNVYENAAEMKKGVRAALENREKDYVFWVNKEALLGEFADLNNFWENLFELNEMQINQEVNGGDYLYLSIQSYKYKYDPEKLIGEKSYIKFRIYDVVYFSTAKQEKYVDSQIKKMKKKGGALEKLRAKSRYEQIKGCVEYIQNKVGMADGFQNKDYSAYGALKNKKGRKQAQSLLLYRMLRELGIENRIVSEKGGEYPTLNLVWLKGKYYVCDPSQGLLLQGKGCLPTKKLVSVYKTAQFKKNITSKISGKAYKDNKYSYTVKYDANGGSGKMKAQKVKGDTSFSLSKNKFKKVGFVFKGWNTKKDGTGESFQNKQKVADLKNKKGTVTLYAQWSVKGQ